ncbi:hypothetical protein [Actinoplanes sp. CA-252034]|uniref:hypothetical protein n=1 Tax=Actinoplanes sp. CA-252034 TaxID=3239906 RepID=UPI003D954925
MAEQVPGGMGERADLDLPDLELITTLDELAEALRTLRVARGNPSYRAIERLIERDGQPRVPFNTVHDAMAGQHMPKRQAVLSIVRALNGGDAKRWLTAWNRVELGRQGLPAVGGTAGSWPRRAPEVSTTTVGGISRIAAVNRRDGASLITNAPSGQIVDVVHTLAAMPAENAAERLNLVPAVRVAAVLAGMDERQAAAILGYMRPAVSAAALTVVEPAVAGDLIALVRTPTSACANILRLIPAGSGAAIISTIENWPAFLDQVTNLTGADILRFLMEMDDGAVGQLFAHPNMPARGPQFLDGASSEGAARVLRAVPAAQTGRWLDSVNPTQVPRLIRNLTDQEFMPILGEMTVARVARPLYEALGPDHLIRLVSLMPPDIVRRWWDQLQRERVLSGEESEQLRAAIRPRS